MAQLPSAKAILPEHPGNRLRGPTLRWELRHSEYGAQADS